MSNDLNVGRHVGFAFAALAAAMLACGRGGDTGDTTQTAGGEVLGADSPRMGTTTTGAGAIDIPTSDEGIIDVLTLVNQSEVEAGQLAMERAKSMNVKSFARTMVQEHTKALQDGRRVARQANIGTSGTTGDTGVKRDTMKSGTKGDTGMKRDTMKSGTKGDTGMGRGTNDTGMSGGTTSSQLCGPYQGGDTSNMTTTGNATTMLQNMHRRTMSMLCSASGDDFDRMYIENQISAHQQALDVVRRMHERVQANQLEQHLTQFEPVLQRHLDRAMNLGRDLGVTTGTQIRDSQGMRGQGTQGMPPTTPGTQGTQGTQRPPR